MSRYRWALRVLLLSGVIIWLLPFNLEAQIGLEYASGEVKYTDNRAVANAEIKLYINGGLYKTTTNTYGGFNVESTGSLVRQVETMGGIEVELRVLINQYIYPLKKRIETKLRRKVKDLSLTIDRDIQFFRGEVKNRQNEHLPDIYILVHGVHNSNTIRDSTYSDKEGIFYFKLPKGSYTVDLVFKDDSKKYKDAYQHRFALPSFEPYFQTLVSAEEDSANTVRLQAAAVILRELVLKNGTRYNELEYLKADSLMKEADLYFKEQEFDKAQSSYDRARTIYALLYTNSLQNGTSNDASFWRGQALTIKRLLNKPRTSDEKNLSNKQMI